MNRRMPGTMNRLRRSRSITCVVDIPPRSSGGFSVMNMLPRLDAPPPGPALPPSEEPMASTAGSAITMSASSCCSFSMAWNEVSGEARVPPMMNPLSSVGK